MGALPLTDPARITAAPAGLPRVLTPGEAPRRRFGAFGTFGALGVSGWALCLLAVAVVLWFATLDARHLLPSDEGRYAEIAREMFLSGDWITPRYNGVLYFEKPPLHLWMTALSYTLFGLGEWQTRLWGACCGLLGLGAMVMAAWRWWGPRVAAGTALVMATTPSWYLGGHFNSLDISVSAALTVTLAATLMAQHPDTVSHIARRRRWMLLAWAGMGAAVLAKGLIGIALPGLVLIVHSLLTRDGRLWGRLHLLPGLAVFLVIVVPWFWAIGSRHPSFPSFFFLHEHLQRYTSAVHRREAPPWYFVPQFVVGFLPWLALLPGMWRAARDERRVALGPGSFQPARLLLTWGVVILLFFSASSSKLPGYILPVMPAAALLGGLALERLPRRVWARWLWGMLALFSLAAALSPWTGRLGKGPDAQASFATFGHWVLAASLLIALGAAVALWLNRVGRQGPSRIAYAAGLYLGLTVALLGHETFGRPASGIDLVPSIQRVLTPDRPLYGVKRLDHTLPFYLQHPLTLVAEPDELAFGLGLEPQRWVPTLQAFETRWRQGPAALALMSPQTHEQLQTAGWPMWTVAADARRVVVVNVPPVDLQRRADPTPTPTLTPTPALTPTPSTAPDSSPATPLHP